MTCLRWANIRQFCLSDGDICSVTLMYKKFIIDFNFDNCYANNLIKTRLSKCINGSLLEYRSRFSRNMIISLQELRRTRKVKFKCEL